VRFPLLSRLLGAVGRDSVVDVLVSSVDVMPTLLELLGIAVPDALEGMRFATWLRGERPEQERTHAFSHAARSHSARFAVRRARLAAQGTGSAKGRTGANTAKCRAAGPGR